MTHARRSRSGSSPPATAASSRCSTARTSCSRSPSEVEIAYFLEATSAIVGGPVRPVARRGLDHHRRTTPSGSSEVREQSTALVTIGACATAGGIQALRNFADVEEFTSVVYARPEYIVDAGDLDADRRRTSRSTSSCSGCPIDKRPAARGASARSSPGARPRMPAHSVCIECKRRGNVCVMVAHGTPCLGPVTHAGCGALCPRYDRGCYGCFGPMETPNTAVAERAGCGALGMDDADVVRVYRTFNAGAPSRSERRATAHERRDRSDRRSPTALARVEGEGAMHVRVARRRGRATSSCASTSRRASSRRSCAAARFTEAPDITARICGICPVAYQMSAVQRDRGRLRRDGRRRHCAALRRLLYCGEWIESHALHVYMLHAPDFLGYPDAIEMAARPPRASSSAGWR